MHTKQKKKGGVLVRFCGGLRIILTGIFIISLCKEKQGADRCFLRTTLFWPDIVYYRMRLCVVRRLACTKTILCPQPKILAQGRRLSMTCFGIF